MKSWVCQCKWIAGHYNILIYNYVLCKVNNLFYLFMLGVVKVQVVNQWNNAGQKPPPLRVYDNIVRYFAVGTPYVPVCVISVYVCGVAHGTK